jgi:hypothetical protein
MKTLLLYLAVAASFASNALARDQNDVFQAFGVGYKSCGAMTEDIKNTRQGAAVYREWVNGFLTGVNRVVLGKANVFEGVDQYSGYKFVLKYCEDNPLDPVLTALEKLMRRYNVPLP